MLMRATAHGGCTDTVRESAPEVGSGRKIPCRTGDSNPSQYCAWPLGPTLYQFVDCLIVIITVVPFSKTGQHFGIISALVISLRK